MLIHLFKIIQFNTNTFFYVKLTMNNSLKVKIYLYKNE